MAGALYQPFPMAPAARGQVWRHAPQYRRPRHFHAEPELNLVTAGSGSFGVGDAELAVAAGDLLWWAPGQDHELLACSDDLELFVVGVIPELSDRALGSIGAPLTGTAQLRLSPGELTRLREACAALVSDGAGSVEHHVAELWCEAHRLRMSVPGTHPLTRRALVSLAMHPELTRAAMAQRAHSSPTEVSRQFHKDMRLTLTTYRTRLRLLQFIRAVDAGAANLLSAALDAGFGSYSQLHRAFHHTLGCTPRAFFRSSVRRAMEDACL